MRIVGLLSLVLGVVGLVACGGEGGRRSGLDAGQAGIQGSDRGIAYLKPAHAAAGDRFGDGLAISAEGDLLAVGVPYEDGLNMGIDSAVQRGPTTADVGAVFVFRRGAGGSWVQEAYLKPAVVMAGAQFGFSLALAFDDTTQRHVLLVGSPGAGSGGATVDPAPTHPPALANSGAAYVFQRDASGTWSQTAYIKPESPMSNGLFGRAVSLSGDGQRAAVGQPGSSDGVVSLYERTSGAWAWKADLKGDTPGDGASFGSALQLDATGSWLLVGAPGEDRWRTEGGVDVGTNETGAAYVFQRDDAGAWNRRHRLQASEEAVGGFFGAAVALSSGADTIAIGEPNAIVGEHATGRVHLYRREASGWRSEGLFVSPQAQAEGRFGDVLAISADGSTLAVANPLENGSAIGLSGVPVFDGRSPQSGAVSLYRRDSAGAWSAPAYIKAPNNQRDLWFGQSLALSATGEALAVNGRDNSDPAGGAAAMWDTAMPWAGAVYLY